MQHRDRGGILIDSHIESCLLQGERGEGGGTGERRLLEDHLTYAHEKQQQEPPNPGALYRSLVVQAHLSGCGYLDRGKPTSQGTGRRGG